MNIVIIAGHIVRDASVKGIEKKVLRFTVETRDGQDDGENRQRINHVPCVLFGPTPELEQVLISSGEGRQVELHGRIVNWNGEANGRPQVEVVVFNRSLTLAKE